LFRDVIATEQCPRCYVIVLTLAGEKKSLLHPLVMGLSSAFSHSLSLIGIAALVHLTHHLVTGDHHHADEGVTNAMRWASAGLVLIVGLWMTWTAWRAKPSQCGCAQHKQDCVFGRRLMNSETNKDAWYVRLPWLHIRAGAITLIGLGYLMHVAFG